MDSDVYKCEHCLMHGYCKVHGQHDDLIYPINSNHNMDELGFNHWENITLPESELILFYKGFGNGDGFKAYCVQDSFCGETDCEIIMDACAFYDGLRHVFMGYWYYPDKDNIIELFQHLEQLEKRFCKGLAGSE